MYFVGGKSGGVADVASVGALDVWELYVPSGLLFVADDGDHRGHVVVGVLDTAVGAGLVSIGACGDFVDAEVLIYIAWEGKR